MSQGLLVSKDDSTGLSHLCFPYDLARLWGRIEHNKIKLPHIMVWADTVSDLILC